MIVIPSFLNCKRRSNKALESDSFNEDVGSSKINRFACFASAFAISTSCCFPTPISLIKVLGDSVSPTTFKYSSALPYVSVQSIANLCPRSFPKNRFSPIVM